MLFRDISTDDIEARVRTEVGIFYELGQHVDETRAYYCHRCRAPCGIDDARLRYDRLRASGTRAEWCALVNATISYAIKDWTCGAREPGVVA